MISPRFGVFKLKNIRGSNFETILPYELSSCVGPTLLFELFSFGVRILNIHCDKKSKTYF